jgi:hypothetical protein
LCDVNTLSGFRLVLVYIHRCLSPCNLIHAPSGARCGLLSASPTCGKGATRVVCRRLVACFPGVSASPRLRSREQGSFRGAVLAPSMRWLPCPSCMRSLPAPRTILARSRVRVRERSMTEASFCPQDGTHSAERWQRSGQCAPAASLAVLYCGCAVTAQTLARGSLQFL